MGASRVAWAGGVPRASKGVLRVEEWIRRALTRFSPSICGFGAGNTAAPPPICGFRARTPDDPRTICGQRACPQIALWAHPLSADCARTGPGNLSALDSTICGLGTLCPHLTVQSADGLLETAVRTSQYNLRIRSLSTTAARQPDGAPTSVPSQGGGAWVGPCVRT